MGRAIEMGQREQLIILKQQGQSLEAIAQQLNLPLSSVRQLSARFKQQGHLKVTIANCGPKQARSDPLMQRASLWLKRHHPQWGAPLIRLKLLDRYGPKPTPSVQTLQRWFVDQHLNKPPTTATTTDWVSQSGTQQLAGGR